MTESQTSQRWITFAQTVAYYVRNALYRSEVLSSVRFGPYKIIKNSSKFYTTDKGETLAIPRYTQRAIVSLMISREGCIDWKCEFFVDATLVTCYRRTKDYAGRVVANYVEDCNAERNYVSYGPFELEGSYLHRFSMFD